MKIRKHLTNEEIERIVKEMDIDILYNKDKNGKIKILKEKILSGKITKEDFMQMMNFLDFRICNQHHYLHNGDWFEELKKYGYLDSIRFYSQELDDIYNKINARVSLV